MRAASSRFRVRSRWPAEGSATARRCIGWPGQKSAASVVFDIAFVFAEKVREDSDGREGEAPTPSHRGTMMARVDDKAVTCEPSPMVRGPGDGTY